jgi:hypothetical protein
MVTKSLYINRKKTVENGLMIFRSFYNLSLYRSVKPFPSQNAFFRSLPSSGVHKCILVIVKEISRFSKHVPHLSIPSPKPISLSVPILCFKYVQYVRISRCTFLPNSAPQPYIFTLHKTSRESVATALSCNIGRVDKQKGCTFIYVVHAMLPKEGSQVYSPGSIAIPLFFRHH